MGQLAVQIAKEHGAHVLATARAVKHPFLRELGADELVDYTRSDFAGLRDVDVVLDTISNDYGPRSLATLKPGGIRRRRRRRRRRPHGGAGAGGGGRAALRRVLPRTLSGGPR
ncbi:zinc-binding dehydrogenase [Streptomyces sp. NBC_00448]|uniref:zinc-binding dehydrogenase n=1 Tax=Streptomyces sp. NBC_00448 TaxID=2903652 RepID=UPI002E21FB38